VAVAALAVAAWIAVMFHARKPATIETERVPPSINEEVEAAIAPFGKNVAREKLPEVQKRAEAGFADALRARSLDASRSRILMHRDELVGPTCFVTEPSTARS